jgi:hypothetical protein
VIGNLFTVAELDPASLRRALADLLTVPDESVDVADAEGDQEGRHWEAPVLCTYRLLPLGDLALELDVTVADAIAGGVTEEGVARGLAARVGSSVLYPEDPAGLGLPSAYWVAVPDGRSVRCRLEAVDTDEDTTYRVDAAEEPVPDLPRARVEVLPEVLDREPIETPVADMFLAGYPTGTTASVEGRIHYDLRVWERLLRRLENDWSPSGRYREDLLRRDLQARDDLEQLVHEIDDEHADGLRSALTRLDRLFRDHTEPEKATESEKATGTVEETVGRWWWHRRPRRAPW